jgi:hypothetical protein
LNLMLNVRCKGFTDCDKASTWTIVTNMVASKPNMANTDYPLFSYIFSTGSFNINKRNKYFHTVPLRFNQMALHDSPLGFGGPSESTTMSFFDNQYADSGPITMGSNVIVSLTTLIAPS